MGEEGIWREESEGEEGKIKDIIITHLDTKKKGENER